MLLFPPSDARSEDDTVKLLFGVYTSDKPTEMYRKFKPALVHLEKHTSEAVKRPVRIRLRIFKSYAAARSALVNCEIDFARFGPASYILAKEKDPDISILAVEERKNQLFFNGIILAREDSGIKTVEDIRGKSFAFGDPTSTIGRYLAQAYLVRNGIKSSDLLKFEYLNRHDRVVNAVLGGRFDVGAAKSSTFKKYKDRGLREVVSFKNVTKPWLACGDLPSDVHAALRKALLAIRDPVVLKAIGKSLTRFRLPQEELFNYVRDEMEKAKEFLSEEGEKTPETASLVPAHK